MDRDLDNANPTILNAAQLPTRRKGGAEFKGPESKFSDVINYKPNFLFPPFCAQGAWKFGDADSAEGSDTEEPIDELEIYGELVA